MVCYPYLQSTGSNVLRDSCRRVRCRHQMDSGGLVNILMHPSQMQVYTDFQYLNYVHLCHFFHKKVPFITVNIRA